MQNPFINIGLNDIRNTQEKTYIKPSEGEYIIEEIVIPVSHFITDKEQKNKIAENERIFRENNILDDDEPDRLPPDEHLGKRIHCWVMVKKGPRDLKDNFFIEPSTGRTWNISENNFPYFKVDQLFNNKNFWINLYPEKEIRNVVFDNMDNAEKNDWEYAMIDTIKFPSMEAQTDGDDFETKQKIDPGKLSNELLKVQEEIKEIRHLVDMPLPWPPKLFIDKEKFLKGSPLGEITRFYKNSRVDIYTKYAQIDGLTSKLTLFDDYNRTLIKEIRTLFSNRRNNLIMRRRFPNEFKTIEYYKPNNKPLGSNSNWPHWKEIEEVDRQYRIIKFYPHRHDDGLRERYERVSETMNKTKEFYEGRDDYLTYRAFKYIRKDSDKSDYYTFSSIFYDAAFITKMHQKFDKNQYRDGHDQVQKMTIDMNPNKNRIIIFFHLNEGEIAPI